MAGAPRTIVISKEDTIALGEELLKWVKNESADPPITRFAQFYAIEKHIPRKTWKSIIQREEFLPYYEEAQAVLTARVMNKDVMDKSFGHRYINLYDRDLVEFEREEAKIKADLNKKQEEENQDVFARKIVEAIRDNEEVSGVAKTSGSEVAAK